MTDNFLSRRMGLSYQDVANDNFKRWPLEEREYEEGLVVLSCETGYWVHNGIKWMRPYDYMESIHGINPDYNDVRAQSLLEVAPKDGIVDIGVPLRYLPDRCQDCIPLTSRRAAR
ncbi:MAG: hypothetical protein OJJ21_22095 [Ferrovibrio sp.]|uniref:hypothetical protein n=1 Tax=Ferrovibrio sp. TaxID=1917215 RepID=UPI00260878D8|nr:hypothetical protein [Ferrovibrio sp.]MCW0236305.1 hypothetical protein [Ferrovibrio sp.]